MILETHNLNMNRSIKLILDVMNHLQLKVMVYCLVLITFCNAQTFPVGQISINFKDPLRTGGTAINGGVQMPGTGRDIGTEVFYPAVSNGSLAALASGQFPVVVFGHGFVMTYDNYDNIYNKLASEGFIVALPRTEGSFSPSHLDFGKDIAFLSEAVKSLNTAVSPSLITVFNNKISPKSALGGHSMGGGCSLVGAQSNTSITCVFNMAAALSNTGGISSQAGASQVNVPALYLSAQRDCVVDTTVQTNHYINTASAKKFQVILKDMTHCDFGNGASALCVLGQNSSGCPNNTANNNLFNRYMNYLLPFLKNQLKDDCSEGVRFMDSISTASSLRSGRKITGSIACVTGIDDFESGKHISVYPVPSQGDLYFEMNTPGLRISEVRIHDITGQLVKQVVPEKSGYLTYKIEGMDLKNGIYLMLVKTSQGEFMRKIQVLQP